MPRIEPPDREKKIVLERYKDKCAVCGKGESRDVAHLYEDATSRSATADRLIVLCPTHNQAQARSHTQSGPPLHDTFDPWLLQAQGKAEYQRGNWPLSYAKARLAAYIFETESYYSDALECLTAALSDIRAIRWGDWLAATMKEAERVCLKYGRKVGRAQRWLFLDRMALVLYDYSRWDESIDVLLASISLARVVQNSVYNPQQSEFDRVTTFKHQAMIRASTARLSSRQSIPNLLDDLDGIAGDLLRVRQYDAFATTLDVARRIALEIGNGPEKAHSYSERALNEENKITHKWALQEHVISEAKYFYRKKDLARTKERMCQAMAVYSKHPVVLEPVRTLRGPMKHDIHEDLRRMEIRYETLLENQIRIDPPISEVPLALRKSSVRRIVRNVMNQ